MKAIVGGVPFWNFQSHVVLCWQKFQSAINFSNLGHCQKCNRLYSLVTSILTIKFGWNWVKTGGAGAFWKSLRRKFCKVHRMTPNWTKIIRHEKYPTYAVHRISIRFALRSAVFKILRIFPLIPMLKFQILNFHKMLIILQTAKISITLHSPVTTLFMIKFGSDRIKNVGLGGVAFWNACSHRV